VTPDREVPIIPKATKYHGLFLSPEKKLCVVAFFDVEYDIQYKIPKYTNNKAASRVFSMG
jgi:hypothetical protein